MFDFLQPILLAYRATFENPIMALFTGLSIMQLYMGIQRMRRVRQENQTWAAEPFNRWRKQIGDDLSFYVAVPIGVLIHELGHAIVVWALGGRVLEFGFFFFWGYVLPSQSWGPNAQWVLSSAGTWGNVLFALVVWLALRNHPLRTVRYAMLRTVRFQIYFAFLYYPLFTAFLQIGDWRTIYDFEATPMLAGGMAVVHVAILLAYWWSDRQGRFDMPAFQTVEMQEQYEQLANTKTAAAQLQRLVLLQRSGSSKHAQTLAKRLVGEYPDSAEIHLLAAASGVEQSDDISQSAADHARQALAIGLTDPASRANAHFIIGGYHVRRHEIDQAIERFNQALANLPGQNSANIHRIYYARAGAYRRANRDEDTIRDLTQALRLAEQQRHVQWAKQYRDELDAMQRTRR